jgi:MFS transporter, putative metabolite:H+ symporter
MAHVPPARNTEMLIFGPDKFYHGMQNRLLNSALIVSALGYFVDVFDLLLYGVVRVPSLSALGYSGQALTDAGLYLQNWQMAGLFLGGIGAGILGDKLGRVRALYFSIGLYALGTTLNGFADSLTMYACCRFLAGIGLAGELGTGVTLVAESLPTEKRGLGTTLVAAFGMTGAVLAGSMGWLVADWRHAYFIGGGMGFVLLFLRLRVHESGIFEKMQQQPGIRRGDFFSLFTNKNRFKRLFFSTFLGVTTWFNSGILLLLAPEFGLARGLATPVHPATAVVWFHVGMVLGDMGSGLLSQALRSRLKAMRIFLGMQVVFVAWYLFGPVQQISTLYAVIALLGLAGGFWAVFITNAAEQFGANLRTTAACTVPSFVRILFIPMSMSFQYLKAPGHLGGSIPAAAVVGAVCLALAFVASFCLEDTFRRDMGDMEV